MKQTYFCYSLAVYTSFADMATNDSFRQGEIVVITLLRILGL